MDMANQLLIHLIIILFPIFIQQFFFSRKKIIDNLHYQILNGCMFGLSAVLCMAAPVQLIGSFQGDLRSIPLIISIVYGSGKYVPGIIALLIAVLYRYYIGGDAVLIAELSFLLVLGPAFLFVKSFLGYSSIRRIAICLLLSLHSVFITYVLLTFYIKSYQYDIEGQIHSLMMSAILAFASLIGMGISTLLKEHLIETAYLKLELERSEKLKIVSQIAASVAHEVRNPLTVVKGFLQLVKESVDDKKKDYLKIALDELDRAEFIITDYLNLAKPHSEQLELIEVASFLGSTLEMMNSYGLIQNVQIQLNCNQTDLYVQADKPKLSQVLLNLIKNGVEAIPDYGEVTLNAYYRFEEIFIEIIDTGKGMSKEDLDNVGTAFFTTKDTGTGLGVLVTVRIVEAMKGKIAFESVVGKGTKVVLRFPAAKKDH
ncbi:ATP-binding protein [Candidatus Pristimantibacillus sp. PTI5]|uniref:ATP-binding protein n=1 Tax=Candidatus Pristimantibacillus sp. PTI5 TaxID=3400422 RepID=UPI003B028B67